MKKMSQREIAEKTGISISQVSRALSNKNGVSQIVREKILAEAVKCGYHNESKCHLKKAALFFRVTSEKSLKELKKIKKRLRRKTYRVISMFPENIDFLDRYHVDDIFAFNLSSGERTVLQKQCRLRHCSLTIVSPTD